jgi:hypothetical protein
MVVFIFVVGDVVMLVTSMNGGAMVVAYVPMPLMGEVRSPCCYIGEAMKSMQGTKH